MKVTALISDELIAEAMELAQAKNITETLKIALQEYVATQKINAASQRIASEPLEFYWTAEELREKNNS
ncbi:hypothetical protein Aoki45_29730 [Algoriphagus sp. oki45]|uniref:type II toxin-antitoxin system VapB family antitoxin n=1 Tax=Algoriphagus sp. oki45 TaxID=3067294 RepID=UPI0028004043|nr:hypothetical protein Aoki45_29730 [Algoriphagus sp. oki45]